MTTILLIVTAGRDGGMTLRGIASPQKGKHDQHT